MEFLSVVTVRLPISFRARITWIAISLPGWRLKSPCTCRHQTVLAPLELFDEFRDQSEQIANQGVVSDLQDWSVLILVNCDDDFGEQFGNGQRFDVLMDVAGCNNKNGAVSAHGQSGE